MLLTLIAIFGTGLSLFAALTVAGWLCRSLWAPSPDQRMTGAEEWERLRTLGANGHSRYSLTWPATRTRPWQKRAP